MKNEMSVKITHCDDKNSKDWDSFLQNHSHSSFYHLFGWKSLLETSLNHKGYYLAALRNNKFIGILPLIYINSLVFGKMLCSMPFLNYGGICSTDKDAEFALINEARKILRSKNAAYLELRNTKKLTEPVPTNEHKVSMTLDLESNPELVWNNLKSKQRTNIRRAYKNNLHIKVGGKELLDIFYAILSKSWRDLGTPIYQKDFFLKILNAFPDNTRIFVVYRDNTPISTAFNGYFRDVIEGMWLGTDRDFRTLNPSYVLYWEMIKHGCENGFNTFHLGRSSISSGGEFFKKKWNADAKQLYWQYILGTATAMPQLNVNNPKYALAIKLWQKFPVELTTALGPKIAKNIP